MKIYLSGERSKIPISEAINNYMEASNMLSKLGFEVVNPLEYASDGYLLQLHLICDIEQMLECDVIFMIGDWKNSKEATIEYNVASIFNKNVLYESNFLEFDTSITVIQDAIHKVCGISFKEYTTKCRARDGFYARIIFVHHCHAIKISDSQIARLVNRDRTTVHYARGKYNDEFRFNKKFRNYATQVQNILENGTGTDCQQ